MEMYLKAWKQYADFSGRSRRSEYWTFMLFYLIIMWIPMLNILYIIAAFIPSLALTARRLHDTGKSGAMILVMFIPIVGAIWLLILMLTDSVPGRNQYGPNPKGVEPINYQNQPVYTPPVHIPTVCPHCKSPNTKRLKDCEWCGNPIA